MCRPAGQKHKPAEDDKNIKKIAKGGSRVADCSSCLLFAL